MDHQKIFSEHVRKLFAYLRKEFHFSVVDDLYLKDTFSCVVAFRNKWRRVELVWELMDNRFNVLIYRATPYKVSYLPDDHFYFFQVVKYYEPDIEITELINITCDQPNLKIFNQKILHHAELLRKYGSGILEGKEWLMRGNLIPDIH